MSQVRHAIQQEVNRAADTIVNLLRDEAEIVVLYILSKNWYAALADQLALALTGKTLSAHIVSSAMAPLPWFRANAGPWAAAARAADVTEPNWWLRATSQAAIPSWYATWAPYVAESSAPTPQATRDELLRAKIPRGVDFTVWLRTAAVMAGMDVDDFTTGRRQLRSVLFNL